MFPRLYLGMICCQREGDIEGKRVNHVKEAALGNSSKKCVQAFPLTEASRGVLSMMGSDNS